ncbi:hypothetical protein [Pedobacter psychrodurus]|uniref:toxin-antitoxin system YwqK family antitoxin n=1 Tax=Pedobacter psychrodurus TaxID=2530456 RepID=UPI00292D5030|nr:hypothetical protein [Pedobacter psychrodurus]
MKFLNALLFFTFLCGYSFGQNIKYFLDDQNEICDSTKGSSYMILFEKKESDTVFKMNQYTMHGSLLTKASFKDSSLSTPHGEFEYYNFLKSNPSSSVFNGNTIDRNSTGTYLESKGNFNLGKKNGVWTEYASDGRVEKIETYVDDVLNGKYVDYGFDGRIIVSGEYINDLREGKWIVFGGSQEDIYKNGRVVKVIKNKEMLAEIEKKRKEEALLNKEKNKYDMPPKEPAGFKNEVSKFMGIANSNDIKFETAIVSFIIKPDGTISEPSVTNITDFSLREKIKEYFIKSTGWKAATIGKEKKPVTSMFRYRLTYQ